MTHSQFQNALRDEILRTGFTQAEFAKKLGVAQKTVECWLADENSSWVRKPNRFEQIGILHLAGKIRK